MKTSAILAAILVTVLSGCRTSSEAIRAEMGSQDNNPPSIRKSAKHPDASVDLAMESAIEAASRLGFAHDASKVADSFLTVTAQWQGRPVALRFHFERLPSGQITYTYSRECDASVYVERGDVKTLRLFQNTLADVVKSKIVSARSWTTDNLQGSIVDGRYRNPQETFSIPVPDWAITQGGVEDRVVPYGERVAFADDTGRFAIVEIGTADDPGDIERLNQPGMLDEIMEGMVETYDAGLPTKLLCHSDMTCIGKTGRFFVCEFTGGGTILDEATGRRPDCYRAYFIFVNGPTLYTLTTQRLKSKGVKWSRELRDSMREELSVFISGLELAGN